MARKIKPNLKDYLRTGKRSATAESAEDAPAPSRAPLSDNSAFLDLLGHSDLQMWKSMLAAGVTVESRHLDPVSIQEDFQSMDKNRFTCYMLTEKGAPLRPVRSDSQLSVCPVLLLKWDETGVLTVYGPNE